VARFRRREGARHNLKNQLKSFSPSGLGTICPVFYSSTRDK